jgi:hypothetical protein
VWSSRWNEICQRKQKYLENSCPFAALSTTNPTCPELNKNPERRGGKPATIWAMVRSCACVTRSGNLHRSNLCTTLYQLQSLLPILCYLTNCDMEAMQKVVTVSTSRHYLRIYMERPREMTETNRMVVLRSETRN